MKYQYPDSLDLVTLSIIESKGLDLAFLQRAESRILSSAEKIFQERRLQSMLDVGCGNGRLTMKFASHFDRMTALEPDAQRLQLAKDNIAGMGLTHVSFIHAPLLEARLPDAHFDVIIFNQIMQHLDTKMLASMLREIYRILKKDGFLVLTTSYSNRSEEFFIKTFLEKETVVYREIREEEFNGLVTNEEHILPVHYFSDDRLETLLAPFETVERTVYDKTYLHPMLSTILYIGKRPA